MTLIKWKGYIIRLDEMGGLKAEQKGGGEMLNRGCAVAVLLLVARLVDTHDK
jgi:hypothetical protein